MKEIVDFIVLIILYIFLFYKKWKRKGKDVLFINTVMYIYLSFVLYFTLMPIITALPFMFDHSYSPMNLVPFIDVTLGRGDFIRQIILNVIMTIPFGFLFPLVNTTNSSPCKLSLCQTTDATRFHALRSILMLNKNPTLLKTTLYTFLFSLSIELLQPLIDGFRSSDITDLITNVLGGIIGYIIYFIFKPFTIKIRNYIKNK